MNIIHRIMSMKYQYKMDTKSNPQIIHMAVNKKEGAIRQGKGWLFSFGSNNINQLLDRLNCKIVRKEYPFHKNMLAIWAKEKDTGREREFLFIPAYMENHGRAFRGWSDNWGGGVATIIKKKGVNVYGYIVLLRREDLDILDQYEGVSSGKYKRTWGKVISALDNSRTHYGYGMAGMGLPVGKVDAIYYKATSKQFNEPSKKYLKAVLKTIEAFWDVPNGIDDIVIR